MEPSFDVDRAQRWFAIEFNNKAWDLIEGPSLSPDQAEELLHVAHASHYHWLAAGKPINQVRSYCLLAQAYLACNLGESALRWANQCSSLCATVPDATPFDHATATLSLAAAYAACGQSASAQAQLSQAQALGEALTHPDDLSVFQQMLARHFPDE